MKCLTISKNDTEMMKRFRRESRRRTGFIIISLVSGIRGGTLVNTNFGFRFQISDGVVMALLVIGYIIIRIRKGRNRGK